MHMHIKLMKTFGNWLIIRYTISKQPPRHLTRSQRQNCTQSPSTVITCFTYTMLPS